MKYQNTYNDTIKITQTAKDLFIHCYADDATTTVIIHRADVNRFIDEVKKFVIVNEGQIGIFSDLDN